LAETVPGVKVIRHVTNRGYGAAIKTGFGAATGNLLAFLDADGTYPPEAFPELCGELLRRDADIVVGARMGDPDSGMPLTRRVGNRFFAGLVNLLGSGAVSDSASGQRVLRRSVLPRLYPLPDGLNFTPVMTTRAVHESLALCEVPIRYSERTGESKLSVIHDGRRFLATILWTALGYNPSRVLGIVGLGLLVVAIAAGLGLVALRASGVTTLGPWGVLGAFVTLVAGVAAISMINLGITFNYLVALFHRKPVRQGLFGHPMIPHLDRAFGWLGLLAIGGGAAVTVVSVLLGFNGWAIDRLWLWLLGAALLSLTGLQLVISWLLMRVLEDLSVRESVTVAELERAGVRGPAVGDVATAQRDVGHIA
jgi:hypothetical protein